MDTKGDLGITTMSHVGHLRRTPEFVTRLRQIVFSDRSIP